MIRKLLPCSALIIFSAWLLAQAGPSQPEGGAAKTPSRLPPGVAILAELGKSIDAKKAKPGDKIEARTASDLLSDGQVVIPRNTKISGHVTDSKAHSKDSPDSRVGIAFDSLEMKDGRALTMQASIQAIARPLQKNAPGAAPPMSERGGTPMATPDAGMPGASTGPSAPSPLPTGPSTEATSTSTTSTVAPLGPTSRGVLGISGLALTDSPQGSILSSQKENVRLDSGTQLMLKTQ